MPTLNYSPVKNSGGAWVYCRPGPNIYERPYWCSRNTFVSEIATTHPPPPPPPPLAPPLVKNPTTKTNITSITSTICVCG